MKSVYTGSEKVAEFENYDELRVGDSKPAFIYEGNELVYPAPVKDGLVLWYDFSGRTNTDSERGIAEDLSGNGNHGTLQNFNYTAESGYDKNKLLFDGVDDYIIDEKKYDSIYALESTFVYTSYNDYRAIISSLNHVAGGHGFALSTYFVNRLRVNVSTVTGLSVNQYSTKNLEDNKIYHVVVSIDDSDKENIQLKMYINGLLEMDNRLMSFAPSGTHDNQGILVGKYSTSYNGYYYDKPIYSAKAYNRPLTPEEVQHNYAIEKERFGIE